MSNNESYPRLLAALDEVRRQWRLHKILEGVLLTAGGALVVLALLVAADNLFHPGAAGRYALACVLWGGLICAVLSLIVRRVMEDRRDDFFASLVEGRHPQMRNKLINALQLGRDHTPGFSASLIEAIVKDADRGLVDTEVGESVDRKPTRNAALFALAGLLLVAGYAAAMTPRFFNGLARVLLPMGDIAPYTRTRLPAEAVEPGTTRIAEGKPLPITVRAQGDAPETARIFRRTGNGSWQVNEMDAVQDGVFRFNVNQVNGAFEYYVTAGDATSPTFAVTVIRPPQVAKLAVVYTYPAYTGLPPRRVEAGDGEINGVAGTTVRLELTASKELSSAELETTKDTIAFDREGDLFVATFALWTPKAKPTADVAGKRLLVAPTRYRILLADTEGYKNYADDEDKKRLLSRSILLRPDAPPEVVLRSEDDRLSVKADKVLKLGIDATDDYGVKLARVVYTVSRGTDVIAKDRELVRFEYPAAGKGRAAEGYEWKLASSGLKVGDTVAYWAEVTDGNVITGPGVKLSKVFRLEVVNPLDVIAKLDTRVKDYVKELRDILALQRTNRAETAGGVAFAALATREILVRDRTRNLARAIEGDGVPLATVIDSLDKLATGWMADVLKLFESGKLRTTDDLAKKDREETLPTQDKIIKELEELLIRLQRNEEAKKALRRMEKKDPAGHKVATTVLSEMIKGLDKLIKDQTELAGKFDRLPKKPGDEVKEDLLKALADLDDLKRRSEKWAKGNVQELTKLPKGFTDDFDLRKDINKVYEEIEKAATRDKAGKIEVSLEDLETGIVKKEAAKMKEDLESWLPDSQDSAKWVMEEPLNKKPLKIPEMPLPKDLQDLVGELLQKADEFDEDADDITSAWGDNLDQAGWGTSDGPISTFSAKGKTGNDQPNNMELGGRSGDGRRGKSTGQMVGDTSKALPGRKTPARVGTEAYEPGKLKTEAQEDPNGSTGGGKKSGAGRRGLQGGTPPDPVKDIGRLSAKQAGMREKMEQLARKLEAQKVSTTRLRDGIKLLDQADKDMTDGKYEDAAKKRRDSMQRLRGAFQGLDRTTATDISRSRELPQEMRRDLLQSSDGGYPAGYEELLKSYYKSLSTGQK